MKEDGEAMSADTHVHPTGQEAAVAATQEPGTSKPGWQIEMPNT